MDADKRNRPAFTAIALAASLAGCFGGSGAPDLRDGKPADRGASAGLEVVYAAPRGQAGDVGEVTLMMSRPMRPLELAGAESPPFATITPPVPGRFQWVGSSGLLFVPDGRHLPKATSFRVDVPAGTKALDGSRLEKPYTLLFSTSRPEVISVEPKNTSRDVDTAAKIKVHFNQRIADAEIARASTMTAGGKPVALDVVRPNPDDETVAVLAPRGPLPKDTEIRLAIAPTLRGREVPLEALKEEIVSFRTYGPLKVVSGGCAFQSDTRCHADEAHVYLTFTNPVLARDVLAAVEIEPPVTLQINDYDDGQARPSVALLSDDFQPSFSYRVRVRAGLRDRYGQALAAAWEGKFETKAYRPQAGIALEGGLFEPGSVRDIPVAALNTKEVNLAIAPLTEKAVLDLMASPPEYQDPGLRRLPPSAIAKLGGAKTSRIMPSAALNTPFSHIIKTADWLDPKTRRGAFIMGISYQPERGRDDVESVPVQVTDLAITTKVSRFGSLVRVTRVSTAAPVAGASVTIRRPGDESARAPVSTGATGFVTIPTDMFMPGRSLNEDPAVIFVRLGDEWAFLPVNDASSTNLGSTWAYSAEAPPFGVIFSERPIYRPGEEVKLKGILRRDAIAGSGLSSKTPAGEAVSITILGPDGRSAGTRTATLSSFGTFSFPFEVHKAASLGGYRIEAELGGATVDASGFFEVAEYVPNEIAVQASTDKSSYVRGDRVALDVQAKSLAGAPASNASVRTFMLRSPASISLPGIETFTIADDVYRQGLREPRQARPKPPPAGSLDYRGRATIPITLDLPDLRGPEEITLEAQVSERTVQPVVARAKILVHPAPIYAAIDAGRGLFVKPKTALSPSIVVLTTEGARIGGVPVGVELIRRTWRRSGAPGSVYGDYRAEDQVAASCSVQSAEDPVSCPLAAEKAGYYIIRATAVDKKGNTASASTSVYVLGKDAPSWGRDESGALELVPDREMYDIGQTARILLKSPFPSATALVTVERSGIYSRRTIQVTGPAPTIDVPITDDLWPNAFVTVVLTRGVGQGDASLGAKAAFRAGTTPLKLRADARKLAIAISPRKAEVRPGDTIDIDIGVKDRAGKPVRAEVTLYAVDEGVLSLRDRKSPDPAAAFGAFRALRVMTAEARADLARVLDLKEALRMSGGFGSGSGRLGGHERKDFRTTAYYNPSILTDSRGLASVSFKLPDSVTTYRITAVAAADDDRAGTAEKTVLATLPLLARPAVPRFLRAGDKVEAGVLVTSRRPGRSTVEVEAWAEGLTADGDLKRVVDLSENESAEVRFSFRAAKVGAAKLHFSAKAGDAEDAVVVTREIKPPAPLEAAAVYGSTPAGGRSEEKLGDLTSMRDDMGGLELYLAPTALVGLGGGVEQLLNYPYGCVEQLTSRMLPLVYLRALSRTHAVAMPADADRLIAESIAKIGPAQRANGGFGIFPDAPYPNDWVTAYALFGLVEAKRNGAPVPGRLISEATRYLEGQLARHAYDTEQVATHVFIADVLAGKEIAEGRAVPGPIREKIAALFEDRSKLPLFARALLAHAMVIARSDPAKLERITSELEANVRLSGPLARAVESGGRFAELMDSDARTTALVLRALLAARPSHPLAPKMARALLADRSGGEWRTTHEAAWALIALDDYSRKAEPSAPNFTARVTVGGAEAARASFQGSAASETKQILPLSAVAQRGGAPLTFHADGEGTLFYEARLRYAPKDLPKAPLERGFSVQRTLRAVDPDALPEALASKAAGAQSSFRAGDLVLAEIIVATPTPRRFVVVEDPLPAGLEPVDTGLSSTSKWLAMALAESGKGAGSSAGSGFVEVWTREELRDDRALFFLDRMPAGIHRFRYLARASTPGVFVAPPTRAEEMYTPELFGRTASAAIQVTGK